MRNNRGSSLVLTMIAMGCLMISFMALISSILYVQKANIFTKRNLTTSDFMNIQLLSMKSKIQNQTGGLMEFIRNIESVQRKFNPTITVDINDPSVFIAQFGFSKSSSVVLQSLTYDVTYKVDLFKFDVTLNPVSILTNSDALKDVSYLRASISLIPQAGSPPGTLNQYSEVFIAK